MKNKRGASHIEIVISFALFIGLVAGLFFLLRPVREPTLTSNVLDIVEAKLQENKVIVTTLPFKVETTGAPPTCIQIKTPIKKDTPEGVKAKEIVVKNRKLELVSFAVVGGTGTNANNWDIRIAPPYDTFYYIQFARGEEFPQGSLTGCAQKNPEFSVPRIDEFLSLKNLLDVSQKNLKSEWKIPRGNDFSVTFKTLSGIRENEDLKKLEKVAPTDVETFSRVLREEILEKNGDTRKREDIIIMVW